MIKIKNNLHKIIKEEKKIIIFILLIFILGLVSGSLFINFISDSDRKLLLDEVGNFFNNIKNLDKSVFGFKASINTLLNNFIQLTMLFLIGISMIGIIVVIFILFFKGFVTGLTIGTILYKFSLKGIIGVILYVVPISLLYILIYLFFSFFIVYVSLKFIKAFIKKDNLNFKTFLGKYTLSYLISIVLIIITSFLDGYISPLLLKLFTFII